MGHPIFTLFTAGLLALSLYAVAAAAQQGDPYAEKRAELVEEVRETARYAGDVAEGGFDEHVMRAMAAVPR
ncbi:MAG TPA: hypothetical protein VHG33_03555, partial [Woeseiaceae bacterium]|nr:hypothetical protein [Woeseiaceae bacterium]